MPWQRDGSVLQSGLRSYAADSAHERMDHNVVGVIESLRLSDDLNNKTAIERANFKGTRIEAVVIVINEGKDSYWKIPNVVIPPQGTSGPDNYHEELPRASSTTLDGSDMLGSATDPTLLDGDYCVVGFIGGHIDQPFMISWWPHPRNNRDPATGNGSSQNYLEQGQRIVKRFQGTKASITSAGSVFIDTTEANAEVVYRNGDSLERKRREGGGDVCLNVKSSRLLEVNFNAPVHKPQEEPDLLQPNPPQGENKQGDALSKFIMNKDFINAVAGRVVQIMGNNDGTDRKDTVLLGENPDPTMGHLLLGEKVQATFNALVANVNALRAAYESHFHASGTPTAPTSGPIDVTPPIAVLQGSLGGGLPPNDIYAPPTPQGNTDAASDMPATDLSEVSLTE